MRDGPLTTAIDQALARLAGLADRERSTLAIREVGTVRSVGHGIAVLSGLPGVRSEELIEFAGDVLGMAFNLAEESVGVIILGEYINIEEGDEVRSTGRIAEVPVHHYHRAYGQSQFFNFRRLVRTAVQLSQLWWKLVVRREGLRAPRAESEQRGVTMTDDPR